MSGDITELLVAARGGDPQALERLVPLVYDELRIIARQRLGPRAHATLDTTALVHEAYLRLCDQTRLRLNDRRHFYAVASLAMRQIIVDYARRRGALKRAGGLRRVELDEAELQVNDQAQEILSLHEALERLSKVSERLARVVEMRFFGGLSVEEVADVLEVDARTVKRDWRKARALLLADLGEGPAA
jgi:RNA polymerase sigma factor (TIGR02999 family)